MSDLLLAGVATGSALTGAIFAPHIHHYGTNAIGRIRHFVGSAPKLSGVIASIRYRWRLLTLDERTSHGMEWFLRANYWRLYDACLNEDSRTQRNNYKRQMDATAAMRAHLGFDRPDADREVPDYSNRDVTLAGAMQEMGHYERYYWEESDE